MCPISPPTPWAPFENFAVQDDAAADAGSEGDHDHAAAALAAAVIILAQGGDIGVIPGADGKARQRLQRLADIEDAPVEVDTAVNAPGGVHRAGDADADSSDLRLG